MQYLLTYATIHEINDKDLYLRSNLYKKGRLSAAAYYRKHGDNSIGTKCDIRNNGTYKQLVLKSSGVPYWIEDKARPCLEKAPGLGHNLGVDLGTDIDNLILKYKTEMERKSPVERISPALEPKEDDFSALIIRKHITNFSELPGFCIR